MAPVDRADSVDTPDTASVPDATNSADTANTADTADTADDGPSFREQVEAFERNLIRKAMNASGGNQSQAARRLRLNRATFYDRLRKYGMTKE